MAPDLQLGASLKTPLRPLIFGTSFLLLFALAACSGDTDATIVQDPEPTPLATSTATAADEPEGSARSNVTLTGVTGGNVGDTAPEFSGIDHWINSEPLSIEDLRGKVVLIDFWTYTCVNCIRTMPFLREWQEKYADRGLVIVGLHAPEFDFEKITANVERATSEFALEYPIAQDNDFQTWRGYNNRFWPAKYLIDQDGIVRYTHFGEGGYHETEKQIRELLEETGASLAGIDLNPDTGPEIDPSIYTAPTDARITRELYGGWNRNATPNGLYVADASYYDAAETTRAYVDPGEHLNQFLFLEGPWFNGLESIKHARATEGYEDYIALRFSARSANAVIDLEAGVEPFRVRVTIEDSDTGLDRALLPEEAGLDIVFDGNETFLDVNEGRMYFVVSLPAFDDRELKFSSNSPDFALFAMTFGAYEDVD